MKVPFVLRVFASSLRRIQPNQTRLLATPAAKPFPRWLRLRGIADYSVRYDTTTKVADAISSSSGGFLSDLHMSSDMVTIMKLEDVEPNRLPVFRTTLRHIDGLTLDSKSIELLDQCCQRLERSCYETVPPVPEAVMATMQLNWRGAPGTLKHQIPADG
jgi:hypothetical protein